MGIADSLVHLETVAFEITARLERLPMGILVCYDIEFPEAARRLALMGSKLVAMPPRSSLCGGCRRAGTSSSP